MNSPKEKALELVEKYKIIIADDVVDMKIIYGTLTNKLAKQCALIAVDEMLNEFYTHPLSKYYWQEVKQEINKL
jgi:hypothetical protein